MKKLLLFLLLFSALSGAQSLPDSPQPHRFMDWPNRGLLASSALTMVGDGLSGERCEAYSIPEINPIAKPFMQHRSGSVVYFSGAFSLEMGSMYWLHSHNHHRIERVVPILVSGVEAYWTVNNYRVAYKWERALKQQ